MTIIHTTTPNTLSKWLDSSKAILIDVREHNERDEESINDTKHIPLSEFEVEKIDSLKKDGKKLVIHCHSGKRSMMACEKIQESNPSYDVWNLEGGIKAWKDAGLPTKT